MKATKRILCLLLGVVLCVGLLAACGGNSGTTSSPAPSASGEVGGLSAGTNITEQGQIKTGDESNLTADTVYKKELTIIMDNNKLGTINEFSSGTSNTSQWAFNMMFDNLMVEDNGEYVPQLAKEATTEDYQHYNFKLRDDVVFHNGEKFTADDVVYTWETSKTAEGAQIKGKLVNITDIEVVNDYEINVTLDNVNVDFYFYLSSPYCGIVNREACEADPEEGMYIGTGPWKVDDFVSNDYCTFVRNDDYWGELPKTEKITLKFVAEEATRLIMLENGDVQAAFSINPTDFPYLESDDRFDTYSYTVNNCAYVAFNMNDPVCGDLNFRKAVASCMKREDAVLAARNGYAVASRDGTFWGFNTEFRNTDIPLIPYDLDAAKEYLAQSSYNGEDIEIVAAFSDITMNAQVIQENLKAIGVTAHVYQTDAPGMASYAKFTDNQAQMICYTGTWNTPASSCRTVYYPGGAANRASYVNDEITKLLDLAPTQTDAADREATYKQIQALAAEDIPYITIYNITHVVGCLKGVGGMNLRADSAHDLSYTYMVEE